jgi:hypothetical protein
MLSLATLTFTGPGTQAVTVTNTGTAALAIISVVASVNFTETDNCVGQSVAVGATCTINVSFVVAAASAGGSSGSVTITDNAADSPESVALTGPQISAPSAILLPMSLVFGAQAIGSSSSTQTVTLANPPNGNSFVAPLVIASVTTNGDFKVFQNACPGSLPSGGGSCTISVSFTPTMTGTRTGTLNVFDNANANPSNIQITQLTGTGQ